MYATKELNFYGVEIIVEFEGDQLGIEITKLEQSLCKVTCNSAFKNTSEPITLKIRRNNRIEIPDKVLQLPPYGLDFKVFSWQEFIYLDYKNSTFKLNIDRGTAEGYYNDNIFDAPRIVSHRFLLTTITILLHSRGLYFLHAAGLERDNFGLLIVGAPGVGKSTCTIQLVQNGWNYLSDDGLLLQEQNESNVIVHSIPNDFKINGKLIQNNPDFLKNSYSIPNFSKRFIDMQNIYPENYKEQCNPKAIIYPAIVPKTKSRLEPVKKSDALGVLIKESPILFVKNQFTAQHLGVLKWLVNNCQNYRLIAGEDLLQDQGKISSLLTNTLSEECHFAN